MFEVLVSGTFQRQFKALPAADQRRIRQGLEALREDPKTPRSGVDLKPLQRADPPKFRLRVGAYRVVYAIKGRKVKVIEVFRRGPGPQRPRRPSATDDSVS